MLATRRTRQLRACGSSLASEILFFGVLFLAWSYCRHRNSAGFDTGARQTAIAIGTINTAILLCSSFVYSAGVGYLRAANNRRMIECCLVAMGLGAAFLVLKFGVEWRDDLANDLFPGADFSIQGPARGGAKLFFVFYFFGTALHGLHLVVGILLVGWIVWRARKGQFSRAYYTPVLLVGLYWSFVDVVWLVLYPMIYLVGRS
jgi:cytochrome c oxidase subunit 3